MEYYSTVTKKWTNDAYNLTDESQKSQGKPHTKEVMYDSLYMKFYETHK